MSRELLIVVSLYLRYNTYHRHNNNIFLRIIDLIVIIHKQIILENKNKK